MFTQSWGYWVLTKSKFWVQIECSISDTIIEYSISPISDLKLSTQYLNSLLFIEYGDFTITNVCLSVWNQNPSASQNESLISQITDLGYLKSWISQISQILGLSNLGYHKSQISDHSDLRSLKYWVLSKTNIEWTLSHEMVKLNCNVFCIHLKEVTKDKKLSVTYFSFWDISVCMELLNHISKGGIAIWSFQQYNLIQNWTFEA